MYRNIGSNGFRVEKLTFKIDVIVLSSTYFPKTSYLCKLIRYYYLQP